jgi:hypothetical protein
MNCILSERRAAPNGGNYTNAIKRGRAPVAPLNTSIEMYCVDPGPLAAEDNATSLPKRL